MGKLESSAGSVTRNAILLGVGLGVLLSGAATAVGYAMADDDCERGLHEVHNDDRKDDTVCLPKGFNSATELRIACEAVGKRIAIVTAGSSPDRFWCK